MQQEVRDSLLEQTNEAILVNEKLLADEKRVMEKVAFDSNAYSLLEMNETLNELNGVEYAIFLQ